MGGCRCSCTKRPTLACASQRPSSLQQVGFLFPATKIFEINYPVHACLKPLSSCSFPRPSNCAKVQGEIVTHVAGIPFSDVNLRTHNVHQPPWTQYSSLSEVSSLSLEFTYLDRAAGDPSPIYSCHVSIPSTKGYCGSCAHSALMSTQEEIIKCMQHIRNAPWGGHNTAELLLAGFWRHFAVSFGRCLLQYVLTVAFCDLCRGGSWGPEVDRRGGEADAHGWAYKWPCAILCGPGQWSAERWSADAGGAGGQLLRVHA